MSLFEHRVLARAGAAALKTWLLLAWLALAMEVPRSLSLQGWFDPDRLLISLSRFLDQAEIASILAAPLGMMAAVLELKKSGILAVFSAAGLTHARVRRLMLIAAVGAAFFSAALFEAAAEVRVRLAPAQSDVLVRMAGTDSWILDYDPQTKEASGAVLFREDTLDLTTASRAKWSPARRVFELQELSARMGPMITLDQAPAPALDRRPFRPLPFSAWLTGQARFREIIAALDRILIGGALTALCALLALALPVNRQWQAYIAFLLIAPAAALGTVSCSIALWNGGPGAVAAQAAWMSLLIGPLTALDVLVDRRGLRLV